MLSEQQIEDRGHDVVANPHNRDAATQHGSRSVGRLEARQEHLGDLVVLDVANREGGRHTLEIQVPAART
jgi:hypothetical protein